MWAQPYHVQGTETMTADHVQQATFLAARRHFGSSFQRFLELSLANTEHVRTSWLGFAECWLDHVGTLRRWVTSCPLQRASFEELRWRRVQEYNTTTCNCNVSIKRRQEASFSPQPLCPRVRVIGTSNVGDQSGTYGEEKNACPFGELNPSFLVVYS